MVKARNRSNLSISSNKSKKSKELRKYEVAYNKCIKMCLKSRVGKKSIKKLKSPKHIKNTAKSSRKYISKKK